MVTPLRRTVVSGGDAMLLAGGHATDGSRERDDDRHERFLHRLVADAERARVVAAERPQRPVVCGAHRTCRERIAHAPMSTSVKSSPQATERTATRSATRFGDL